MPAQPLTADRFLLGAKARQTVWSTPPGRVPVHADARRVSALIAAALSGMAVLSLIRFGAAPTRIDAAIAIVATGLAAWRAAAATSRRRRLPAPANDNPARPLLPPHALRW